MLLRCPLAPELDSYIRPQSSALFAVTVIVTVATIAVKTTPTTRAVIVMKEISTKHENKRLIEESYMMPLACVR